MFGVYTHSERHTSSEHLLAGDGFRPPAPRCPSGPETACRTFFYDTWISGFIRSDVSPKQASSGRLTRTAPQPPDRSKSGLFSATVHQCPSLIVKDPNPLSVGQTLKDVKAPEENGALAGSSPSLGNGTVPLSG